MANASESGSGEHTVRSLDDQRRKHSPAQPRLREAPKPVDAREARLVDDALNSLNSLEHQVGTRALYLAITQVHDHESDFMARARSAVPEFVDIARELMEGVGMTLPPPGPRKTPIPPQAANTT
ncbi:hypothetical protein GCM10018963_62760 [Saccharothrix longispora]